MKQIHETSKKFNLYSANTERTKDRVMCYENKTFYNTLFFSSDGCHPAGTAAAAASVENSASRFQPTLLQDTKVKLCVLPLVQRLPRLCQLKGNDCMTMWTVTQLKQVNAPLGAGPKKLSRVKSEKAKSVSPQVVPPSNSNQKWKCSTKNKATVLQS